MALPPRAGLSEQIQIFQDTFFNEATPMISHAPMPSVPKPPQRGVHSAQNSSSSIIISPPVQPTVHQSPHKIAKHRLSISPLSPLKPSQRNKLNMVSFKPPVDNRRQTDSIQKKQPLMSRFKTVAQKPLADAGLATVAAGKENNHPVIFPAPPGLNLSIENYYQKAPGKRLLEPATIKDGRPQKRQRVDDGPLPAPDSFPPIIDDGLKPGHSYAMLIGMAILRSPVRKLTLSQIYKWISDTYAFYSPQDAGWQNSIRHNLSLNKAFIKQERPKDDPGKGNYWAIDPGMEYLFIKDKTLRKPASSNDNNLQVMSTTVLEPSLPPMPTSFQEPALPPQLPPMPVSLAEPLSILPMAASQIKKQSELSSDATIIASDTAVPEDQTANEKNASASALIEPTDATILDSSLYSPIPAAALHSSPPISRHIDVHSGTPPPVPRAPLGSSVNRSRKRKSASMDDSGYISSLESSALRSNQNNRHLAQEGGDRSRLKRGRAEEEIARLRASSYDSPTKNRSRNGYHPTSSSPLRHTSHNENTSGHMLPPPLTPAVKLKAPLKPPPSVSPSTNLRMHRDKVRHMLASPLRRMATASEEVQGWGSPTAFDESLYNFTDETDFALDNANLGSAFEIFQDDSLPNLFTTMHNGSPVKQPSYKRLRLDRSQSASALSEVTNSVSRRNVTSAPFLKVPNQSPGLSLDTPSKFFDNLPSSPSKFFNNLQSPSKVPAGALDPSMGDENSWVPLDEFCAPEFLQDVDDFGGLDILQGFEKIGANVQPQQLFSAPPVQPQLMTYQQQQRQQNQQQARPSKASQKPSFGRSYTTTF